MKGSEAAHLNIKGSTATPPSLLPTPYSLLPTSYSLLPTPSPLPPPPRLWSLAVGLMALALAAALALIVALALGWNNPRPSQSRAWEAPGFPLRLVARPGQGAVTWVGHPTGDFAFEVEAHPLTASSLNGYGLVYRRLDAAQATVFAIGSDGYYAILRVAGEEEVPLVDWQQFPHVRRGQHNNRLRVDCAGPVCRFYVNDEFATAIEGDAWLEGEVGVWGHSLDGKEMAVRFEYARLWED